MDAITAGPPPAPRNQVTVAAMLASMAMAMLVGGMLAVWAVKRSSAIDAGESWLPSGITVPEVPTNVMLIAFPALCSFAQWAVWASKRNDRANTVFALAVSAFVAVLIINAQAFVWNQMGVAVGEGEYGSMFYAVTGTFFALMVAGIVFSLVAMFRYAAGRSGDRELLIAHAVFWYAMTVVFAAIWFLVYVTK